MPSSGSSGAGPAEPSPLTCLPRLRGRVWEGAVEGHSPPPRTPTRLPFAHTRLPLQGEVREGALELPLASPLPILASPFRGRFGWGPWKARSPTRLPHVWGWPDLVPTRVASG